MAGWQAGLLVLVQSVLQQLHVVLPANTAANNLQTHHPLVQDHRSWQAECTAGWQAGLLVLCADCLAAWACAACKHSFKQRANSACQKFILRARVPVLLRLSSTWLQLLQAPDVDDVHNA